MATQQEVPQIDFQLLDKTVAANTDLVSKAYGGKGFGSDEFIQFYNNNLIFKAAVQALRENTQKLAQVPHLQKQITMLEKQIEMLRQSNSEVKSV